MELDNPINDNNLKNSNFASELNNFLDNLIEGDLFTIDKIENDIAVCENRRTKKFINISLKFLPQNLTENNIVKFSKGEFTLDNAETEKVSESIRSKFNSLIKK